jgi:hypothetical protein
MLEQLYAFYSPNAFAMAIFYVNGRTYTLDPTTGAITRGQAVDWTPPGDPAQWARWWLVFEWPSEIGDDGTWADPGTWDDGGVWDCSLSAAEVRDIRLIPREWNAAHAIGYVTLAAPDHFLTLSVEAS